MRMTIKQLEVFVAVAQEGSVQAASQRLHLTQSATSMALADLERQLECRIFDRVGRRIQINDTGRLLLPQALDVISRCEDMERLALDEHSAGGLLRLGASLTLGSYLIPALMGQHLLRQRAQKLSLEVGNSRHIIDQLLKFQIDIAFIEGYCHDPEIEVIPWRDDELVIFAAPSHPLAQKEEVSLADLAAADWILREPGSGTREVFDHLVLGHLSHLHLAMELSHTEAIRCIIETGYGISCLSRLSVASALHSGHLVELKTPLTHLQRQFLILVHRRKYRGQRLQEFLDACMNFSISHLAPPTSHLPLRKP